MPPANAAGFPCLKALAGVREMPSGAPELLAAACVTQTRGRATPQIQSGLAGRVEWLHGQPNPEATRPLGCTPFFRHRSCPEDAQWTQLVCYGVASATMPAASFLAAAVKVLTPERLHHREASAPQEVCVGGT